MPFPPMPPFPSTPIKPHILNGILTDRNGNNIITDSEVIAINETNSGSKRILTRANGEILINLADISTWSINDKIRIQIKDSKGNGEVYYTKPLTGTGNTSITRVIRKISSRNRMDKFTERCII